MPLTPTATPTASSAPSASPTWPTGILAGRPHRTSGALALHVLEAMEAFQRSSDQGCRDQTRNDRRTPWRCCPSAAHDGQLD
jgi:hypothetical protein